MSEAVIIGWDRALMAAEKVKQRLRRAAGALEGAGVPYAVAGGNAVAEWVARIDGPQGKPSAGVHLLFAGEKVRPADEHPCPEREESERAADSQVLALPDLVRMKLTSWRLKDRLHLLDMIQVGLIDATWPARLPPPLAERLQALLDNPDG